MKAVWHALKTNPLLAGIICVTACTVSVRTVDTGGVSLTGALIRLLLVFTCSAFLLLISGSKVFENSNHRTGYIILRLLPVFIIPVCSSFYVIKTNLDAQTPFRSDFLLLALLTLVELLFAGLFEELCFRAVINDAFLYQFREKKGVFIWIALVSSLIFGIVHVLGSDVSTPVALGQAVLKTISTALFGFMLLIMYWKTHNIFGCALVHMIYDLIAQIPNLVFDSGAAAPARNYVLNNTTTVSGITLDLGFIAVIIYIVQLAVNAIILLTMIRVLKSIDFKAIRKEW